MTAPTSFAATADRCLPVAGFAAGASAFASYLPVVKLPGAEVPGLFQRAEIRHDAGSRSLRARGNKSRIGFDMAAPRIGPTQALPGHPIPLRDRRHLPA